MKTRVAIILALFVAAAYLSQAFVAPHSPAQSAAREDKCFACHDAMGDKASVAYKKDLHFAKGISCAECHGGDMNGEDQESAMNPKKGFIGVPKKDIISERCGRCHNDANIMKKYGYKGKTGQLAMLKKSVHGQSTMKDNLMILQCTTCHGGHGIKPVASPEALVSPKSIIGICTKCHSDANFMKQYNPALPIDQLEKYRTSVHGVKNAQGDMKTAVCSSCHGNHDILKSSDATSHVNVFNIPATCGKCHSNAQYMKQYGIPTSQLDDFTNSVHGNALLKKHDASAPSCNSCHGNHGAVPPGVQSIGNVCGTCHVLNAQLFAKSLHKKAFDDKNIPECETCHGKHRIQPATEALLSTGPNTICGKCHTASLEPKGFNSAIAMKRLIDSLTSDEKTAIQLINGAEQKGMEVSDAKFKLRDVRQARLKSRTAVHSFNLKEFESTIGEGLKITSMAKAEAESAVHEFFFRRWGLGVSTLIITLLAFGIWLYIKRLERGK